MPRIRHRFQPKDIYNLLHQIARELVALIAQSSSQGQQRHQRRLNQEFYVICMLNALFGDPRLHLAKLHPCYGATAALSSASRNRHHQSSADLERAQKFYQDKPLTDVKQSADTGKLRRNAVTELLRFVCQMEHRVSSPKPGSSHRSNEDPWEQQYGLAYQMLLNGDVLSATRFLSQHGKHNLAMCLSQSVSATAFLKTQIGHHAAQMGTPANSLPSFN